MVTNQQSENRWVSLVFLETGPGKKPVYTLLTRTQIVEITAPRNVEWTGASKGSVQGVCTYEQDSVPVVDLGIYFENTSTKKQEKVKAKQLVILRTTRIRNDRSQKLALLSSRPVQTLRLSVEQQKNLIDDRSDMPSLLAETHIVRGFFTAPQMHIALFDFDTISREADMVIQPEMS